jgi:hypothetical protein
MMGKLLLLASLLCCGAAAHAEPPEPSAILEAGAAGEWGPERPAYGPALGVEVTPIPEWLELEAGVSPLFSRGRTEWDMDFLFKKPWTLSDTAEFMFGVGPTWSHTIEHGVAADTAGASAALDFMFWPGRARRFGWYVEPSFNYSFGAGHEQTVGISAGLLIAVP